MWNTFDVNVLVNGNRCKQYNHDGKTYIEAKDGSDWYFQIQNNYSGRVLAVCSVDGLNVLTGEPATENDTGYVIDAYHSQKIKGFRFSDDEWALFKFGYKVNKDTGAKNEKVYAVSKGDGKEKNCGVIGVKLFYEVPKVVEYVPPVTPTWYNTAGYSGSCNYARTGSYSLNASYHVSGATLSSNVNWSPTPVGGLYGEGRFGYNTTTPPPEYQEYDGPVACASAGSPPLPTADKYYLDMKYGNLLKDAIADAKAVRQTALANPKSANPIKFQKLAGVKQPPKPRGFDIGTEWGKKEKSKVEVIDFTRGCEAFSTDIYYASRESLIEMGVPLSNNIKVSLPQSFANKYATPPAGWVGLL